ncbi:hypothetical protein cyc_00911 [Cyclospora cayetanensis]|uniref:Uncharacterized protein n=1 Tax=Cyclospora cayetanensis TaxID=88456 RepID=A0A1D3D4X9_9EIME|nr:hypothetical protein cyc_00911 [Cyclospora cayetanensis]
MPSPSAVSANSPDSVTATASLTPRSTHLLGGADLLLLPSFSSKLASRLRRLRVLRAPAGAVPLISCLGVTLEDLSVEGLHQQEANQIHCWLCAASKWTASFKLLITDPLPFVTV